MGSFDIDDRGDSAAEKGLAIDKSEDSGSSDGKLGKNGVADVAHIAEMDVLADHAVAATAAAADPTIVDWTSLDDPSNPRNWSKAKKLTNVVLVSLSVLYCNLATTMFAPGANILRREFGFTSDAVQILTITIASLGFALGQLFVPPLSEVFGRLPIYRTSAIFLPWIHCRLCAKHKRRRVPHLPLLYRPGRCVLHVDWGWHCRRPLASGGEGCGHGDFHSWTTLRSCMLTC